MYRLYTAINIFIPVIPNYYFFLAMIYDHSANQQNAIPINEKTNKTDRKKNYKSSNDVDDIGILIVIIYSFFKKCVWEVQRLSLYFFKKINIEHIQLTVFTFALLN